MLPSTFLSLHSAVLFILPLSLTPEPFLGLSVSVCLHECTPVLVDIYVSLCLFVPFPHSQDREKKKGGI